jgi:hypothetical protein
MFDAPRNSLALVPWGKVEVGVQLPLWALIAMSKFTAAIVGYTKANVVSNTSRITNAMSSVCTVLDNSFKIMYGTMPLVLPPRAIETTF